MFLSMNEDISNLVEKSFQKETGQKSMDTS